MLIICSSKVNSIVFNPNTTILGLFRAAIAESGSSLCPWAYQRNYKQYAYALATYLNPDFKKDASSKDLLEYLQTVPAAKLKEAQQTFQVRNWKC